MRLRIIHNIVSTEYALFKEIFTEICKGRAWITCDKAAVIERSGLECFHMYKNSVKERSRRQKAYEIAVLEPLLEEHSCKTQEQLDLKLRVSEEAISDQ